MKGQRLPSYLLKVGKKMLVRASLANQERATCSAAFTVQTKHGARQCRAKKERAIGEVRCGRCWVRCCAAYRYVKPWTVGAIHYTLAVLTPGFRSPSPLPLNSPVSSISLVSFLSAFCLLFSFFSYVFSLFFCIIQNSSLFHSDISNKSPWKRQNRRS